MEVERYFLADFGVNIVFFDDVIFFHINNNRHMYVIYYDYYADCWGITDGINNSKANLLKITKGPDPKNELSSDIWSCNLFVVYGKIQLVEEADLCNTYTIQCTHWDIITQNETGILRINTNCRPRKKEGLTIYDYKWFDFIAGPDGLYR